MVVCTGSENHPLLFCLFYASRRFQFLFNFHKFYSIFRNRDHHTLGVFHYVRAKSHILRELLFLMLDTGVEELLRQIKKSTYPLNLILFKDPAI